MRATLTAHGKKPSYWKLDDSVREEMENKQRQSTHVNGSSIIIMAVLV